MRKILWGLGAVAVIGAVAFVAFGERLLLRMVERQVRHTLSGDAFREMTGGLHVVVCGAGSPMPDVDRAGPCLVVIAGERIMVVDAGSGAPRRLAPAGIPSGRIEDVFITHFHSDHIDGLGELMLQRWANGTRQEPLPVHGPTGIETIVAGFNQAYAPDVGYRVAHHGPAIMPPAGAGGVARPFAVPPAGEGVVVLEADGLKVTAFAVPHPPIEPAVGYRFDYRGRSVVISGDTAPSAEVQKFAQGVDVLLHEALNAEMVGIVTGVAQQVGATELAQITRDILTYHTTPVQAAQIAQAAAVKHLVFYHLVPPLPRRPLERVFVKGVADVYDGAVTVARDGTWIALPPDSDEINIGQRF